jgi:hypothetical protein
MRLARTTLSSTMARAAQPTVWTEMMPMPTVLIAKSSTPNAPPAPTWSAWRKSPFVAV